MQLSDEQAEAVEQAADWFEHSDEQIFRLFGYAGTGKTTLAKYFDRQLERRHVEYGAFTGKAAYVLSQKGCPASTLHRLAYRLIPNTSPPKFILNEESILYDTDLLIVDEVSMVGEDLGQDIESFGCKILVLGDPAQLPPIHGTGYFTDEEPDIMLKEIHRQAKDNPIIDMATRVRLHKPLPIGMYGESEVRYQMDPEVCLAADQVIVGKNATRRLYNQAFRRQYGRGPWQDGAGLPEEGDKLVCLRNNHEIGLLNGSLWKVKRVHDDSSFFVVLDLESEDGEDFLPKVECHPEYFIGERVEPRKERNANSFDYGYALTCHKSQGSQWNNVVIVDESRSFRENKHRWLYTAITRAAEKVTIFMKG